MTSGVMTLAYGPASYIRMATGLARSLRLNAPGVPIAIITDRDESSLERWFDAVVPLKEEYGTGLAQKLHLDRYSPFDRTLFIDSDVLIYRPLNTLWDRFEPGCGLGIFGIEMAPGETHYAVEDLSAFMAGLGLSRMVMTNTGIVYLEAGETAQRVFATARDIAKNASELGVRRHPAGSFNDEPIVAAAAVLEGARIVSPGEPPLFCLGAFGTAGMEPINVLRQRSLQRFQGAEAEPVAIHFNVDSQQSWIYDRELRRLELGPVLGRTGVASIVTFTRRLGAGAKTLGRRMSSKSGRRTLARRVLRTSWIASLLPVDLYVRFGSKDPADVVARAARWRWRGRPFTFVQVGSNDGRTGDPLHRTIMSRPVAGVLIEPIPRLFEQLQHTYEGKHGLEFVNAAISRDPGTRTLYFIQPRSGDPVWADLLGSFHQDVVLSHRSEVEDLDRRVETLDVPCRTLESVVSEQAGQRLDLIHVDAEGADYEILQSIDLNGPRAPRFLLFEQKHLGADRTAALALVESAGYHLTDLGMDVFASRPRFKRRRAHAARGRA